jgi:hypothetical protein
MASWPMAALEATRVTRTLEKVQAPQVRPCGDVTVSTTEIAQGSQLSISTYKKFGPFRLFPAPNSSCLREKPPVRLGIRALDILAALVERPGELVCKGA